MLLPSPLPNPWIPNSKKLAVTNVKPLPMLEDEGMSRPGLRVPLLAYTRPCVSVTSRLRAVLNGLIALLPCPLGTPRNYLEIGNWKLETPNIWFFHILEEF